MVLLYLKLYKYMLLPQASSLNLICSSYTCWCIGCAKGMPLVCVQSHIPCFFPVHFMVWREVPMLTYSWVFSFLNWISSTSGCSLSTSFSFDTMAPSLSVNFSKYTSSSQVTFLDINVHLNNGYPYTPVQICLGIFQHPHLP